MWPWRAAADPRRHDSVMTYNLPSTVRELYEAEEYLLAAVVLAFSGVWYTRPRTARHVIHAY